MWFVKASRSLRVAKLIVSSQTDLIDEAPFHCQQSVEKAMKGFLAFHKVRFAKIHDLEKLIALIATVDPKLAQILLPAESLTRYAVSYRYPDAQEEPITAETILEAVRLAEKFYDEISSRLPFEVFK